MDPFVEWYTQGARGNRSQASIHPTNVTWSILRVSRVLSVSNIIIIAALLTGKNKHCNSECIYMHQPSLWQNKKKIRFAVTQFRTRVHPISRLKNAWNASRPGVTHPSAYYVIRTPARSLARRDNVIREAEFCTISVLLRECDSLIYCFRLPLVGKSIFLARHVRHFCLVMQLICKYLWLL